MNTANPTFASLLIGTQAGGVRVIMGELHGRRDFELLDYLQPHFHIGAKKQLKTRLFNFFAVNRQV